MRRMARANAHSTLDARKVSSRRRRRAGDASKASRAPRCRRSRALIAFDVFSSSDSRRLGCKAEKWSTHLCFLINHLVEMH